jgi:hypothetical protein
MPNLADFEIPKATDSTSYSKQLAIELQEEVQQSFDQILESVNR